MSAYLDIHTYPPLASCPGVPSEAQEKQNLPQLGHNRAELAIASQQPDGAWGWHEPKRGDNVEKQTNARPTLSDEPKHLFALRNMAERTGLEPATPRRDRPVF